MKWFFIFVVSSLLMIAMVQAHNLFFLRLGTMQTDCQSNLTSDQSDPCNAALWVLMGK